MKTTLTLRSLAWWVAITLMCLWAIMLVIGL